MDLRDCIGWRDLCHVHTWVKPAENNFVLNKIKWNFCFDSKFVVVSEIWPFKVEFFITGLNGLNLLEWVKLSLLEWVTGMTLLEWVKFSHFWIRFSFVNKSFKATCSSLITLSSSQNLWLYDEMLLFLFQPLAVPICCRELPALQYLKTTIQKVSNNPSN